MPAHIAEESPVAPEVIAAAYLKVAAEARALEAQRIARRVVEQTMRAAQAAPESTSEWVSTLDREPVDRQRVLVLSSTWAAPKVLEFQTNPFRRFMDVAEGCWYWYPERMSWAPMPATDKAPGAA